MLKRICAGLLAHVDAGKTTLSEALLYESRTAVPALGRVDHRDAYLDTRRPGAGAGHHHFLQAGACL
ncbi:MAG: GTP-binding protein [Lawsonibacter sp.]